MYLIEACQEFGYGIRAQFDGSFGRFLRYEALSIGGKSFFCCHLLLRDRAALVFVFCCALLASRARRPAMQQKQKHRGAFMVLLRGLPEPLTHSRRRGRWDAAANQQKTPGRVYCFAARPPGTAHSLTQGRRGHPEKHNKQTPGHVHFFCCAASRNRSLTNTPSQKKT